LLQLQQNVEQGTQALQAIGMKAAMGAPLSPEEQQQMQAGPQLLQQAQQQMQSLPPEISTVAVREDASEDHDTEAAVLFDWMNGPNGRKFQYGNPQQQAAFQNAYLHWQKHISVSQQLKAAAQAPMPPKPPSISIAADKMPADVQAGIVQMAQIPTQATPETFDTHATKVMNRSMAEKIIPDSLYTQQLHDKSSGAPTETGPTSSNPTRKLRR
jgi:hypothetical protein